MVCDACGEKYGRDEGSANLHVSPPRPDAKHFEALVIAGQSYRIRESLTLDLCRTCVRKALAHLGLSTDVCELPEPVPQIGDPERPSSGALTEEDLRQLGLADPESLRA